jgi:hypothetical protein
MDLDVSYLKAHHIHLIKVKGRLDSYYASQLENSLEPVLRRAMNPGEDKALGPGILLSALRVILVQGKLGQENIA